MVNSPLIRPAISGGGTYGYVARGGGRLTSHEPRTENEPLALTSTMKILNFGSKDCQMPSEQRLCPSSSVFIHVTRPVELR